MDLHKIKSFFKARNTLMEMLADRGNEIPEKYDVKIIAENIERIYFKISD